MLKTLNIQDIRQKALKAIDHRTRIITAGLGLDELRAVLRGDPPTEKPNPRYKVHTTSFLFHIRPRYYQRASTFFSHTLRLGFITAFLFSIVSLTGVILMIYYTPSPDEAYQSILIIRSNVAFGNLMRDMHRFGAEAMVVFTVLHMLRTYFTGSYKKERSFTWLTGMVLLLITLGLSFSGYLLPWDQLAYWAVTIGTSMAEAAPLFGEEVNLLLRGAPDIGHGGLLRFYLLHVVLLPLLAIWFISIHYYKVSREHGISLPAKYEEGLVEKEEEKAGKQRIDLIPDLLTHELFLISLGIFFLVVFTAFFYGGAPLEHIANPQQTPLDTMAPWYFLWLQGMLKIGDKTLMGIILPTIIFGILFAVPYLDRNPHRSMFKRPLAIGLGILVTLVLVVLTYMGLPQWGIELPPATRIVQDLAPEEGTGPLRSVPFEQLYPGIYEVNVNQPSRMCPELDFGCPEFEAVFAEFTQKINAAEESGALPNVRALITIEMWQYNLIRVTPQIFWNDPETGEPREYDKQIFLHENRLGH
ncbi:MAG: cytochrome b N-terminal domain-containing protein [Anaerolineales bacterium]|nr:cytochrome b N-terminal domain-containing protein [Anaerolineales bacterium]